MIGYKNITRMIAAIISRRFATLYELQTVYSIADALDMYEVIAVNSYNEAAYAEAARREQEARRNS